MVVLLLETAVDAELFTTTDRGGQREKRRTGECWRAARESDARWDGADAEMAGEREVRMISLDAKIKLAGRCWFSRGDRVGRSVARVASIASPAWLEIRYEL